ncbi:hypothetical protein Bpla01_42390 [Burkholderia plantarii]|nr:hypothetical protein Bpla01_42390 [Burkholderia plantarii]
MPADHAMPDLVAFQAAVLRAVRYAADGAIAAIGVVPRRVEPGYGYVRPGPPIGAGGGFVMDRFVEKPRCELAEQYVHSGEYLWNSGVFVMRASEMSIPEASRRIPGGCEHGHANVARCGTNRSARPAGRCPPA